MTQMRKLVGFLAVMFMVLMAVPLISYAAEEPQTEKAWQKMADMNEPRLQFQTEIINGKIYAIGGFNATTVTSSVEVYDPTTDQWTNLAPMPTARSKIQTEVIDGKIYVIGGYNKRPLKTMEVYDPATDQWTILAPMNSERMYFQTEVIDGKIYAIGGYRYTNATPPGGEVLSTAEVYDPVTDKWSNIASMSTPREYFQTEIIDGKIYAIGGCADSALATAEVYDPALNKWKDIESMSYRRKIFQTEVIDKKIYAIGGPSLSTTEVYDPVNNVWNKLKSMSSERGYLKTLVSDDKVYAIGGQKNSTVYLAEVDVYNLETDEWTSLAPISIARSEFCLELLNGKVYVIGGYCAKGYLSSVEAYTLTALPSPTNLTATAGNAQVVLTWDAVDGATSYNIKRSETEAGTYSPVSSVTGSAITFTDSGLTNGTTYYYTVSAVKSGEESADSNVATATPKAPANKLKLVLEVKQEKQLSVREELSDNADMTWLSSETAVAAVDDNGMLKAIKPGNTVITCTSKDASYSETINVLVVDLDLQLAVDLKVGEKCRLTVDDLADKAKVTWVSDDATIAAVSAKGRVTAASEGLTYITAVDEQGKEIGRIYIRVR